MIRVTIYFEAGYYVIPDADKETAELVYEQIAQGNRFILVNNDETRVMGNIFMADKITHVTFEEVEIMGREYDDIPF